MANIANFVDSFRRTELARQSRFEVSFDIPKQLLKANGDPRNPHYIGYDDLTLRCESAQLPSRTLMTTEQKIYGITEKYPYETSYTDAEFTFYVSDSMKEKVLFDNWLNLVSPKNTYNMNYKNEYQTTVSIYQYGLDEKYTYRAYLRKAFPISVNQLDLDWSSDSIHKLTVVFAYSDWVAGVFS
ncbi:MAG: hypothetical protein WCK82_12505 [Bacteroidota bacterium]